MSDSSATDPRRIPPVLFALRLVWVVVQFLFVYWLGESGASFFYQGF